MIGLRDVSMPYACCPCKWKDMDGSVWRLSVTAHHTSSMETVVGEILVILMLFRTGAGE